MGYSENDLNNAQMDIESKIDALYQALVVNKNAGVQLSGSNVINGDVVSIATANTAQQLPNVSAKQNVTLIALKGNLGTVYVGFSSSLSNTHYAVAFDPKDTYDFPITNLDMLYIYGNAGDGVSYVAV